MSDARRALRSLERANQMDLKAVMRVLRLSYGIQGKERHKLLQPFVDTTRIRTMTPDKLSSAILDSRYNDAGNTAKDILPPSARFTTPAPVSSKLLSEVLTTRVKSPRPLHYNSKRTVPPIVSPPVAMLIQNATGKGYTPTLPEPLFKPLHGKREANLRWRYFSKMIRKAKPPLPAQLREEMERKSRLGLHSSRRCHGSNNSLMGSSLEDQPNTSGDTDAAGWEEWEQQIIQTIKAWNMRGEEQRQQRWETGRFHPSIGGKPAKEGTITMRLYRRMWQHLLDDIPVLNVQLATPKSAKAKGSDGLTETGFPVSNPSLLTPAFTVSKSSQSYLSRKGLGLKLQAQVNDFDRIGIAEDMVVPTGKKGKNKKSASSRS
ncbi:hypothetical protein BG011_010166 [Mortierella polycephala]|uniref:LYR motif-containing protein Cup1-like N-terminal domain-containing protein n=1 Tax=Mortierella polycephala TaxID=41804 RepID=A0A9P6TVZ5_9FUNG|nr:hypothetical protein BG011_010166 [Mortierella polycephala]